MVRFTPQAARDAVKEGNSIPIVEHEDVRKRLTAEIQELSKLRFGWDNRSALPPRATSIRFAMTAVVDLGFEDLSDLAIESVGVQPASGAVMFSLTHVKTKRNVVFIIPVAGIVQWQRVYGHPETIIEGTIIMNDGPDFEDSLKRLNHVIDLLHE